MHNSLYFNFVIFPHSTLPYSYGLPSSLFLIILFSILSSILPIFCHLFFSIQARHMLQQKWEFALDPTCEVKRSLNRLKAMERASSAGCHRDAELAFLAHSSACWNRSSLMLFLLLHFFNFPSFILLSFLKSV